MPAAVLGSALWCDFARLCGQADRMNAPGINPVNCSSAYSVKCVLFIRKLRLGTQPSSGHWQTTTAVSRQPISLSRQVLTLKWIANISDFTCQSPRSTRTLLVRKFKLIVFMNCFLFAMIAILYRN